MTMPTSLIPLIRISLKSKRTIGSALMMKIAQKMARSSILIDCGNFRTDCSEMI